MRRASPPRAGSLDYLNDPALAAFFSAREHEAYYRSLKSVDQRRGFHDRLIVALTQMLELVDERVEPLIDDILARSAREDRPWLFADSLRRDLVEEVQAEEPAGMDLLGVVDPVDFEALRVAYRSAALRHHPDRGGSNTDMAAINYAYELLHARLSQQSAPSVPSAWAPEPPTARDYLWSAVFLLFETAIDDWELDEATEWLERLTSGPNSGTSAEPAPEPKEAQPTHLIQPPRATPYQFARDASGTEDRRLIDLVQPCSTLAERLSAAHSRSGAAERSLEIAEIGLKRATAVGLNYGGYVRKARDIVEGRRKPRFTLNHTRQIENALKFGAIEQRRHERDSQRVAGHATAGEVSRLARQELLARTTFIQGLPADQDLPSGGGRTQLVPHPEYFSRLENLSTEQQAEYREAFGPAPRLDLVEKYTWIRLTSLLRSAIYYLPDINVSKLASETQLLGDLQPRCHSYASSNADVLLTLAGLDNGAAVRLAHELRTLLEPRTSKRESRGTILVQHVHPGLVEGTPQFLHEAKLLCDRFREEQP